MWQETSESVVPLRSGLTTGSCATACSVAAARALFSEQYSDEVEITLPRGKSVELKIKQYLPLSKNTGMRVETVKDAAPTQPVPISPAK